MYSQQAQKNQKGFSLIEMMIALVIGLFLMGGVISVYLSSSQSSRVNTALRTMQENGRFALASLKNSIQMAGYIDSYDPAVLVDPFPTADNDELTIRTQSDFDCTGTSTLALAAPNTGFAENKIELSAGELICTGNAAGAGSPQTLIDGVDQIRILYGLDDDDDGIADRYVRAQDVGAANWKENVSSVRIALLLNSINDLKPANETKSYELLDINSGDITDRRLHRVFTTTILIRNRMI